MDLLGFLGISNEIKNPIRITKEALSQAIIRTVQGKSKICVPTPDLWDEWYVMLPTINLNKFLSTYSPFRKYKLNEWDCNAFMAEMYYRMRRQWGNVAAGMIIMPWNKPGVNHALNWRYVPETGLIELVEPQTGKRFNYPTGTKYNSCMG